MRLAVVSPFVDRRHGSERALAEVLERLARDYPCEVHLFAQRVEDLAMVPSSVRDSEGSGRVIWHRVAPHGGPHLLQFIRWYFSNRAAREEFVRLSGKPFDLVFSPGINCADADVILVHAVFRRLQELALQKAPGLQPGRDKIPNEPADPQASFSKPALAGLPRALHRKIYYWWLAGLERRIYGDPGVTLAAVAPRTKSELVKSFQRQDVAVIPNAVATETFSPAARLAQRETMRTRFGFAADDFVLLLIGNDWTNKGLPAVLQAMARLPEIPLRLLVVGEDALEPFRKMAESLKVAERCCWKGPAAEVIGFYGAADVYVSPSLEDSFGMPVAEAMACGLPVITSAFAGISAYVKDGVNAIVLQDPGDTEALAARLQEMYSDVTGREAMGHAAADIASTWTWERNAAEVWELLQGALTRKATGAATKATKS